MNYEKHYNSLMNKTKNRLLESYVEKHHIIPRCMNGTNDKDNLVTLTPEEHYVAHQLLVKIYPNSPKLIYAAKMMTIGENRNNKLYGWLRRKFSVIHSDVMKGKPNWNKGGKLSEATIQKMRKPKSAKHKQKLSEVKKGKKRQPLSDEWKKNISEGNKGKKLTEEHKQKISLANKGKPKSEETKQKMKKPKSKTSKLKGRP